MRALIAAALALVPAAALAEPAFVRDCSERDTIETLAEPWEASTATLAKGAVRVAVIDRGEPAVAAMELLVLTPPVDQSGYRRCRVVGTARGAGFASMNFAERGTAYDPARGLLIDMPVEISDPSTDVLVARQLTVAIRQDTGAVAGELIR